MSATKTWARQPKIRVIDQFYDNEAFINSFAKKITGYNPGDIDHIVFSYHGLPLSHLRKIHPSESPVDCSCQAKMPHYGKSCYKATCYETTRLLAEAIGLREGTFSTSFQSRLTNNWTAPFTDELLVELIKKGKKKVLVVAPSFVTDCLETIVEISMEYGEKFHTMGGELVLVESLNDSDEWVEAIIEIAGL
jgi:ferrochelatase